MSKRATLAPGALPARSSDDLLDELEKKLYDQFSLGMMGRFNAICEGWTDIDYINLAVELSHKSDGIDLLEVPEQFVGIKGDRIGLFTPGQPGNATRGGIKRMLPLAIMLKPYVFLMQAFDGLIFILDHDEAGLEAAHKLESEGFKSEVNYVTLDPKAHPNSCAKKQVCIEDLLSLDIQRRFFELTPATCTAEYEEGKLIRFCWGHNSKAALRDYVIENACLNDVIEIVQLVKRIRSAFGFPA